MRYRLRTLLIPLAMGSPVLVWLWPGEHWLGTTLGWVAFGGFFALWYWMLRRAQSLHPRTRGYPNYSGATGGES